MLADLLLSSLDLWLLVVPPFPLPLLFVVFMLLLIEVQWLLVYSLCESCTEISSLLSVVLFSFCLVFAAFTSSFPTFVSRLLPSMSRLQYRNKIQREHCICCLVDENLLVLYECGPHNSGCGSTLELFGSSKPFLFPSSITSYLNKYTEGISSLLTSLNLLTTEGMQQSSWWKHIAMLMCSFGLHCSLA